MVVGVVRAIAIAHGDIGVKCQRIKEIVTPPIIRLSHGGVGNVKMCGAEELVVGINVMDFNQRARV